MWQWLSRFFMAIWFVGMVVVAVRGTPAQGQVEGDSSKQYFPTMLRNAPVLEIPPLSGYMGLAVVGTNEATELYTLRADGNEVLRLTTNSVAEIDPQWSPNGNQIAFLQPQSDAPGQLQAMVMNRDGSGVQAIGTPKMGDHGEVKWSPNGRYLLTVIGNGVPLAEGALTLLAVDGSEDREIASGVGYDRAWQIGWSPTGRYVHYGQEGNLWIYTLNTGATVNLGAVLTYFPDRAQILWHPHRDELVYMTSNEEGVIVSPGGTGRRTLFQGGYLLGGWLEAGNQLLLTRSGFDPYYYGVALYTLPFSGGDVVPLAVPEQYGLTLGGISPSGDVVLYQDSFNTGRMYMHPLLGEPRVLNGAYCADATSSPCFLGKEVAWADNGTVVLYGMSAWDAIGRRDAHTIVYSPLGANAATSVRIRGLQTPTFLPTSSTYAMAYEKASVGGYPEPAYSYVQQLQLPGGATTPLFTDLGNYVDVVEWRYLP